MTVNGIKYRIKSNENGKSEPYSNFYKRMKQSNLTLTREEIIKINSEKEWKNNPSRPIRDDQGRVIVRGIKLPKTIWKFDKAYRNSQDYVPFLYTLKLKDLAKRNFIAFYRKKDLKFVYDWNDKSDLLEIDIDRLDPNCRYIKAKNKNQPKRKPQDCEMRAA